MNTKIIMTASAIFLAVVGVILTFAPQEIAQYMDMSVTTDFQIILQLLGALYFSFAMLNWMTKGSYVGGIYNRPTVVANFAHFTIGALALIKAAIANSGQPILTLIITAIYSIFAILFAMLLFRSPVKSNKV